MFMRRNGRPVRSGGPVASGIDSGNEAELMKPQSKQVVIVIKDDTWMIFITRTNDTS